ncbi:MAG: 23S rRNA (uracil(1939)-C(5))-methyltransferase RlmD [Clostridia bacterium]|nr:23S rRNA (uracil(1939)-C(5))-methyltransferase RlmD [Clostridia bacterium]
MIQKNDELEVEIVDNGFEGEGIAKVDDFVIFIPEAIAGEKVKIKIVKVNKKIAYGKLLGVLKSSEIRVVPDCETYSKCGGCNLRHIDYQASLEMKKNAVKNTLRKALKRDVAINDMMAMENPCYYRNKLQYPVGVNENGELVMGVYASRSHRIVPTTDCKIQNQDCQKVAQDCFAFMKAHSISGYNEANGTGLVRHIIVRIGVKTDEIMVIFVLNSWDLPYQEEFIKTIITQNPKVKTIVKNLNNKNTNVILGRENQTIYGDGFIYDYLGDKKFKISPLSFYQVNPIQTVKLYQRAVEYAELTGEETIFDLYCGVGTIGIFASNKAKQIYGIETIENAIKDARENAKINNIQNAEFFVGDVENVLPQFLEERKIKPDVVFLDPPRRGCDRTAVQTLLEITPKRIVYISCNPASLARDLSLFEEKYEIQKISLCDMFPGTGHIESVVKLEVKGE